MSDTQLLALAQMNIDDQNIKIKALRRALEKIRDEDYRGNRHDSHFIAKRALEENP
jgi:hypothetical protein